MFLFSLFMPIASRIHLDIFSMIFGEGTPDIDLKDVASDAVHHCAKDIEGFKDAYDYLRQHPLVLYLTSSTQPDMWAFDLGGIRAYGLSGFLHKEGTTLVRYFVV